MGHGDAGTEDGHPGPAPADDFRRENREGLQDPAATLAAILSGPAKPKAKGHGRKGAKDYPAARRVQVPHPKHKAGDLCPSASRPNSTGS